MAECIHGFDEGFCDTCYPRVAPEPVKAPRASAPRAARTSTARTPRATLTGTAVRIATAPGAPASLTLHSRRVHHATHVRTLESIAVDGALRADATPDVDLSSATTRELRATATVPDGRPVSDFVAFSLAQDSHRWQELRDGAEGTHWSDAARATKATDLVILAVPVSALGDDIVFADGDAAGSTTRFSVGLEAGNQALRRLHSVDPDFLDAELLVAGPVSLDDVAVIAVANDKVRDQVRRIFADAGRTAPRIAVYPPVFQPPLD